MNNKGKRNHNLDIVKALCAFMVVTIHCPSIFLPPYIEASTRIAVPMFFAISGYFYNKSTLSGTFRRISKLLILLTVTELFYAVMYIIGGQTDKVEAAVDNGLINILLGKFTLWLPGWFLLVSAYTYVIAFIIEKARIRAAALMVSAALLLLIQWLNPFDINSNTVVLRGLPYFITGMLIRRYETRLKRIPFKVYVISSVVFEMLVLAEKYFLVHRNIMMRSPIYAGTIPLLISLFGIALFHETYNAPFLIFTGKNLSMYIYCMHIAVMSVLSRLGLEYESLWLCVISILLTCIVYYTLNSAKTVIRHIIELPEQLESLYGMETTDIVSNTALPVYRKAQSIARNDSSPVYSESAYREDIYEPESSYEEQEYKVG